jgi:carbonic anhydrase
LFTINIISNTILQNKNIYLDGPKEWPNRCTNGFRQSPINIITDKNTKPSNDYVKFSYKMPENSDQHQFYNDGEKLSINAKIGSIEYFDTDTNTIDKFEAHKIELHLPSEHYITEDGITNRYVLEMQIHHKITSRQNILINHEFAPVNVKQVIVSMLFVQQDSEFGDRFFESMGITEKNLNKEGGLNLPNEGEFLKDILYPPAAFASGFDYLAFEGLMNLLGSSNNMYFYYGSTTTPPCEENVLWMVYGTPRSLSTSQFNFLKKILVKKDKDGNLKGNNREVKLYDVVKRGFIKHNRNGLRKLGGLSLFHRFLK